MHAIEHLQDNAWKTPRHYAEEFLRDTVPDYVARGYFSDKTLTADSFTAVEWLPYSKR